MAPGSSVALDDLVEVVVEVPHVVLHEVVECRGLVSRNRLRSNLVEVVPRSGTEELFGRNRFHHPRYVEVEAAPQRQELIPRRVLVSLGGDPRILRVSGKYEVVLELGANETLVVVGSRVYQVADDLSWAPLARSRSLSS